MGEYRAGARTVRRKGVKLCSRFHVGRVDVVAPCVSLTNDTDVIFIES